MQSAVLTAGMQVALGKCCDALDALKERLPQTDTERREMARSYVTGERAAGRSLSWQNAARMPVPLHACVSAWLHACASPRPTLPNTTTPATPPLTALRAHRHHDSCCSEYCARTTRRERQPPHPARWSRRRKDPCRRPPARGATRPLHAGEPCRVREGDIVSLCP